MGRGAGADLFDDDNAQQVAVRHNFRGSIYVTLLAGSGPNGGAVPLAGNGLVDWFDEWVQDRARKPNPEKLRAAERPEMHLFVLFPGFTTAPFSASDVLTRPDKPLPELKPILPEGITDVGS